MAGLCININTTLLGGFEVTLQSVSNTCSDNSFNARNTSPTRPEDYILSVSVKEMAHSVPTKASLGTGNPRGGHAILSLFR